MRIHALSVASAVSYSAVALPACRVSAGLAAEDIADRRAATDQHEPASVTMAVLPGELVRAPVKDRDGKPVEGDVPGTLTATVPGTDEAPVTEKLVLVPKSGGMLATASTQVDCRGVTTASPGHNAMAIGWNGR